MQMRQNNIFDIKMILTYQEIHQIHLGTIPIFISLKLFIILRDFGFAYFLCQIWTVTMETKLCNVKQKFWFHNKLMQWRNVLKCFLVPICACWAFKICSRAHTIRNFHIFSLIFDVLINIHKYANQVFKSKLHQKKGQCLSSTVTPI